MNEIKFTNDGKKVVVVGKLNAQETIVQEVFVTEKGAELPSGENFVVKSLHDEPVITYKDKREKDLEIRLKSLEKQLSEEEGKIQSYERLVLEPLKEKAKCLKSMMGDKAEAYQQLINFITGNIKYVVFKKYGMPEIKTYEEFLKLLDTTDSYYNTERFDGLRLVSLFGRSEGKVDYKINRYGDGSGSSEEIYPANDYQEAVEKVIDIISKAGRYSKENIDFLKEHKADINKQQYKEWYINEEKNRVTHNERCSENLEEAKTELQKSSDDLESFRKDYAYPVE
jgi:hypothetical protein